MTYRKLSSGYARVFYNLNDMVAINQSNKIVYQVSQKFVNVTPQSVIIKSFDDVDCWYDNPKLYIFSNTNLLCFALPLCAGSAKIS